MNLKLKIATNTLVQIIGRLITSGVTFLITVLVTRQFGLEGYGEFTKIMVYVALFYLISDFGFNAVVLKQMTEEEEKQEFLFSNLFGLRLIFALFLIFFALAILSFLPFNSYLNQGYSPTVKLGIIILSLTIITQAIFTTGNVIFQKKLRYDLSVLASSFGSALTAIFVLSFTYLTAPLLAIISSYIFGGIFMAAVSIYFVKKIIKNFRLGFNSVIWLKYFKQALPLSATLIFNLIYFRIDMFILSFTRPNIEVGIYGFAYKFFEFPLVIPTFLMNSIYPVMLLKEKESRGKLVKIIKTTAAVLLILSVSLTVISIIFAPLITLVRSDVDRSITALRLLSFSLPLFFLSSLFMWALITIGKQKIMMLIYFFSMLLNIILNLVFIPRYGYMAAVITTIFSELIVVLLTGYALVNLLKRDDPLRVKNYIE